MPKVFIVQNQPGKNLEPAREYGELEVILQNGDNGEVAAIRLERKLARFELGDYLLLIGHPIHIGIAMHLILRKHRGVSCLVWDRYHLRYNIERAEVI